MSQVTRIDSKIVPWSANLRFRVNESCEYNSLTWFNLTGGNGEPSISSDWTSGVNHANGSTLNNIPKTDANGNHVDSILQEDNGNRIKVNSLLGNIEAFRVGQNGDALDIGTYGASTHPEINSLVPGTTIGSILQGKENGHLVIGIRDNDNNDGFYIIGKSNQHQAGGLYNKIIASFQASGNVGIGISLPTNKFEVDHNSSTSYSGFFKNQNTNSRGLLIRGGSANNTSSILFKCEDNLLNEKFKINGAGQVFVNGALTHGSDKRIKENINECNYGLNDILKLNSVKYDLINGLKNQLGLIAQDVKKIIPNCVTGEEGNVKKGQILNINYISLIPVLINAIKEQQNQINNLKSDIKEIKKELNL